jgi:hypothetical protein
MAIRDSRIASGAGAIPPAAPNITPANNFAIEVEKRYWLHIALGRDLVNGSVDVLGTQLEEVVE